MKELIRELTSVQGGPGDESEIREKIRENVEDHADDIESDGFGNLIARKGDGEKTLMLAAHMDQVALSVRKIDENGFIHVKKIWGIYPRELVNQEVIVNPSEGDTGVSGVIGTKPVHMFGKDEEVKAQDMENISVDIGAESREEVRNLGVRKGDYIYLDSEFRELRNDHIKAAGLDDRIGCAVLIEALKNFGEDYELAAVFTVQEEVGTKGSQTAAFGVDPDFAINVDVTISRDLPFLEDEGYNYESSLGEGVGINIIESQGKRLIAPEKIKDWMIETAEDEEIEYFRNLSGGGDAFKLSLTRDGVPTGAISIPIRNMHSPVEVAKISDIKEASKFISKLPSTLENHFDV